MSRATPRLREFAERLISLETGRNSTARQGWAADQVCEKLRPPLVTLMGSGGFRALFLRALALANTEVSWLGAVQVKADGRLEVLNDDAVAPEEIAEGSVVLIAHLLGLLVAFIGENLTISMVREAWPKLSPPPPKVPDGS